MFSYGSFNSISFATVTPSFVTRGEPNLRLKTTFRPLGPKVTLTVLARAFTPWSIALRASSRYFRSFAAIVYLLEKLRMIGTLDRRVLNNSEVEGRVQGLRTRAKSPRSFQDATAGTGRNSNSSPLVTSA